MQREQDRAFIAAPPQKHKLNMLFIFFKTSLVVFSASAAFLSLIFMLSPELFRRIEEFLGLEFGGGAADFATILEGKINIVNDWVYDNRVFFGPFLAVLAALNTRNAFFF